jgi:hypothetical protein
VKRYGLFVGVNDYRDGAIENLRCAVQDATSLSGLFEHRLDFAECAVLTNPRASEITDRLEQFQARLQPGDLFVFYFAGHGKSHVNGHVLLLNDCRLNTLGDPHPVGILGVKSLRSLTDEWTGVSRALIFDACRRSLRGARDGGEGSGFNGPGWRDCLTTKGVKANASPAQRQFGALNSCQEEGQAVELERHGVFTQALMDVVKVRADAGRGVALDAAMVAEVGQRMDTLCREAGHALGQRPELMGDPVEISPQTLSQLNVGLATANPVTPVTSLEQGSAPQQPPSQVVSVSPPAPEGDRAGVMKKRIEIVDWRMSDQEVKAAWAKAREIDTEDGYRDYLKRLKEGHALVAHTVGYVYPAEERLKELAQQRIRRNQRSYFWTVVAVAVLGIIWASFWLW